MFSLENKNRRTFPQKMKKRSYRKITPLVEKRRNSRILAYLDRRPFGIYAAGRLLQPGCVMAAQGILVPSVKVRILAGLFSNKKLKMLPKWRNWQTRQVQVLVSVTGGGGSSPLFGIYFICFCSRSKKFFRCLLKEIKKHIE